MSPNCFELKQGNKVTAHHLDSFTSLSAGDSTLEFEVEVISLVQQTPWQKLVNDVFPLVCLALVPTLLGLVGLYLYKKASAQPQGKKKSKDKKSKKK